MTTNHTLTTLLLGWQDADEPTVLHAKTGDGTPYRVEEYVLGESRVAVLVPMSATVTPRRSDLAALMSSLVNDLGVDRAVYLRPGSPSIVAMLTYIPRHMVPLDKRPASPRKHTIHVSPSQVLPDGTPGLFEQHPLALLDEQGFTDWLAKNRG